MNLWATKSITELRAQADETSERSLKRPLGPWAWWRSASARSSAPASSS